MKNLESATNKELNELLELSIARAFRMCGLGNEAEAMQSKRDALNIKDEIDSREDMELLSKCEIISKTFSIQGRNRASNKEIGLGFL